MVTNTEKLLNDYINFFTQKFSIDNLDGADEIITPFTDNLNDLISIYVEYQDDNNITLTDDGNTIDELKMMGLDLTVKTRQQLLHSILNGYGVDLDENDRIYINTTVDNFPQSKHSLVQAILKTNDLLFTKKRNIINLFDEEVWNFLYEENFGGSEKVDMVGKSGLNYKVDYTMGATKKRPEIIIQFVNNPTFDALTTQEYIHGDIVKNRINRRNKEIDYYILVNDVDNDIPKKSKSVIDNSEVKMIQWSNKEDLIKLK